MEYKKVIKRLLSFCPPLSFSTSPLSLPPITPLLTLYKGQICQEFEFFGDVQLEVSEGWISSQSEMLEILDCFAEPGAVNKRESSVHCCFWTFYGTC